MKRGRPPRGFNSWFDYDAALAEGYTPSLRVCDRCQTPKPEHSFKVEKDGYVRKACNQCLGFTKTRPSSSLTEEQRRAKNRYESERRASAVASTIAIDCRKWDRKKGFAPCDLTPSSVAMLIQDGCSYCGETAIRMTLDRIDNNRGHTLDNVVAACLRCNVHRGAMPYEAWLYLVPYVRKAKELGLFDQWVFTPSRN